jgi:hypothetical protein
MAIVAATGMLGSGFRKESLEAAMAAGAELIGCDAGTTDGGPAYLATARPAFSAQALRRDLALILAAAQRSGARVVIGSAGMAGTDAGVDLLAGMVREIAAGLSWRCRLARIYAEIERPRLAMLAAQDRIRPLPPAGPLTEADIASTLRAVAVMGVEPLQAALNAGAQVVIAGRCTDAAIFAALPIGAGYSAGLAWHMGKILECGAACVEQRAAPDCLLGVIDGEGFEVRPLRLDYRCTPQSVASHALYETGDPHVLVEPSGTLLLAGSRYEAVDDRSVRVTGSRFEPAGDYTNKIEGVRLLGHSAIVLGGIRDPFILAGLDAWLAGIEAQVAERFAAAFPGADYDVVTRVYGRDGVMGPLEPTPRVAGHEVGILWDVIAPTQELASAMASSLAHLALHYPIPKWAGLITGVALAFSPAAVPRGPVHAFHLNHVALARDPLELFRTEFDDA